jgi:hypothetical protein
VTRPPQPQPYPGEGGAPAVPETGTGHLVLAYYDALDRPMVGVVHLMNSRDETIELDVVEGRVVAELPRGIYRVVASLFDVDNRPAYRTEMVIL